jgi:hypothetical protein
MPFPINVQVENPINDPLRIESCTAEVADNGDITISGEVVHTGTDGVRRYNPALMFTVVDKYNIPIGSGRTLAGGEFLVPGQRAYFVGTVPRIGQSARFGKVIVTAIPNSGFRESKKRGKSTS